jgi:hypothetical protein
MLSVAEEDDHTVLPVHDPNMDMNISQEMQDSGGRGTILPSDHREDVDTAMPHTEDMLRNGEDIGRVDVVRKHSGTV